MSVYKDIDFIKSCKAHIYHKIGSTHNITINTELLRYFKNPTDNSVKPYNDYINDILKRTTLVGEVEKSIKFCGEASNKKVYIGLIDSLPNVTRNIAYSDESELPEEFKPYLKSKGWKDFVLCSVRSDSSNLLEKKMKQYPKYFIDTLFTGMPQELYYLIKKDGFDFFYEDDEIKIFPDFVSKPFHSIQIESWNNLKSTLNKNPSTIKDNYDLIVNFLQQIEFVVFLKDDNLKGYKYKSIFTFEKMGSAGISLLKRVKNKVEQFYKDNFFLDPSFIKDSLDIFVNTDTKYNFVVFNFSLSDKTLGHHYTSFVDMYRRFELDDLIQRLKSGDEIVYFTRVSKNDKNCEDNNQVGGDIRYRFDEVKYYSHLKPTLKTIFGSILPIKVINAYSTTTRIHTYCSEFLLVQVGNNTYEISIKSITYSVLRYLNRYVLKNLRGASDRFKQFKQNFKLKMDQALKDNPNIVYDYGDSKMGYYFTSLPAAVEIYVKAVENPQISYSRFFLETASDYSSQILPEIKKATIKPSIVSMLLWRSTFRKLFGDKSDYHKALVLSRDTSEFQKRTGLILTLNKEQLDFFNLTKKYLQDPVLGFDIFLPCFYSDNFIVIPRQHDNNLLEIFKLLIDKGVEHDRQELEDKINRLVCENITYKQEKFSLAKIGSTEITPNNAHKVLEILFDFMLKTVQLYTLWYCPPVFVLNYDRFIQNTDPYYFSNFNEIYKGDFIYNIRHLTDKLKGEIDKLLSSVYSAKKEKYFVYFHYHNALRYGVLHAHIYPTTIYGKIDDKIGRHFDAGVTRYFLWDKDVKYTDYSNKDIVIQSTVMVPIDQLNNQSILDDQIKKDLELAKREFLFN